jgi:hypothetical protein
VQAIALAWTSRASNGRQLTKQKKGKVQPSTASFKSEWVRSTS